MDNSTPTYNTLSTLTNVEITFQPTQPILAGNGGSIDNGGFDYLTCLCVIIGSLGTVGNLFVFAILSKNLSKSPSMTECLILNQSFVDMMSSLQIILSSLVLPVYNPASSYVWNDFICRFWSSNVIIIKLLN